MAHRHEVRMTPAKRRRHPQNSAIVAALPAACGGGDAARTQTSNSAEESPSFFSEDHRRNQRLVSLISLSQNEPMKHGYAHVSTDDQSPTLQIAALKGILRYGVERCSGFVFTKAPRCCFSVFWKKERRAWQVSIGHNAP